MTTIFSSATIFLRSKAAILLSARLSHPNNVCPSVRPSVCLSVCLSHGWISQKRCKLYRITKSLPSAAWKTLVLETVKLFYKFKGDHLERGS